MYLVVCTSVCPTVHARPLAWGHIRVFGERKLLYKFGTVQTIKYTAGKLLFWQGNYFCQKLH